MDRGAWRATVHRASKSQTGLKRLNTHTHLTDASFTFHETYQPLPQNLGKSYSMLILKS